MMDIVNTITDVGSLEPIVDSNDSRKNLYITFPIPEICKTEDCILGIDEAGRGPVLGPMVYGMCVCPKSKETELKESGCADSKTLTEEQREQLFEKICLLGNFLSWEVEVISPTYICSSMLKRYKVSLNEVSHNAAISLIRRSLEAGIQLKEVYLDTVGPPEKYQEKLQSIFPDIKVTVSKKADSIYPIVSAASICAKVIRDVFLRGWKFPELDDQEERKWGSGYPNDPETKKFLNDILDPVFGFPQLVRFSWSTAERILDDSAIFVEWEDEENEVKNTPSITNFFGKPSKKIERHRFFKERNMTPVKHL